MPEYELEDYAAAYPPGLSFRERQRTDSKIVCVVGAHNSGNRFVRDLAQHLVNESGEMWRCVVQSLPAAEVPTADRYIVVIRDPFMSALSQHRNGLADHIDDALDQVWQGIGQATVVARMKPSMTVMYPDAVAQVDYETARIAAWLDLPFVPYAGEVFDGDAKNRATTSPAA